MTAHRPRQPPLLVPALAVFAVSAILAYVAIALGAIGLALAATVVAGLAITALLVLAVAHDNAAARDHRAGTPAAASSRRPQR